LVICNHVGYARQGCCWRLWMRICIWWLMTEDMLNRGFVFIHSAFAQDCSWMAHLNICNW
jgi:hypothetical protein